MEDVVGQEVVLVVGVVGAHLGLLVVALVLLQLSDLYLLTDLLDLSQAVELVLGLLEASEHLLRHICDLREVAHREPLDRELLGEALRDVAITQVVVIHRALGLDRIEATVVVREDEPLARDGDPGTATTEDDDRVRHTWFVQAIEGVDGEAEAQLLHLCDILLRQFIEEPHPLICPCLRGEQESGGGQE